MEIVIASIVIPVLTTIGAILAWLAKIRWSEEYRLATEKRIEVASERVAVAEARVAAADKHAEFLERELRAVAEFGPAKIREYIDSMRILDKQKIAELEALLDRTREEAKTKEMELQEMKETDASNREVLLDLEDYLRISTDQIKYLDERIQQLMKRDDEIASVQKIVDRPDFPIDVINAYLSALETKKRGVRYAREHEKRKLQSQANLRATIESYHAKKAVAERAESTARAMKAELPPSDS